MTVNRMMALVVLCLSHVALGTTTPSVRIVGGNLATKTQFPYQVSVRDSRNPSNHNHMCGGVLIGYSEVLTTAHCVSDVPLQNLYIVTGTTSLSLSIPGYESVNASYVRIHEFYRPNGYSNNIAFIRLSKKLPDNRVDIRPATLLSDLPNENANCSVSGWGDTNGTSYSPTISPDLRFAYVSYVSNAECKKRYAYVQADGVCAAKSEAIGGPCGKLDYGDPLHCAEGLLGLFSWSEGCGPKNVPGVYTSIAFHLFWISQKMNESPTTMIPTTKPTTKETTNPTSKVTTKGTTNAGITMKPTSRFTTAKPTTRLTSKPTIEPTSKPNGSRFNSANSFVAFLTFVLVFFL